MNCDVCGSSKIKIRISKNYFYYECFFCRCEICCTDYFIDEDKFNKLRGYE